MKKVVMLFAEGFEEVEALMTVDLLRRAEVEVTMASVEDGMEQVMGSHGIGITMDGNMNEVNWEQQDAVILPGGMPGTLHLGDSEAVCEMVKKMNAEGKIVAAICAAPSVLGACGVLEGKRATSYPGFEEKLTGATVVTDQPVVADGNVITSRGLGTSMEFGFKLIELLVSKEKAEEIRQQIIFMYSL
nr:DJ-1/PfpI family protein [Eubacterium sp.]